MKRWHWLQIRPDGAVVAGEQSGPRATTSQTGSGARSGGPRRLRWSALLILLIGLLLGGPVLGAPVESPMRERVAAQSFDFPPLKLPFAAGTGQIVFGYGPAANHTGGDEYALDFCQGTECAAGGVGDFVLAPTDLIHVFTDRSDGADQNGPDDFHLFEVATDGGTRLCMSLGRFELTIPGVRSGDLVPQGTVLGQLVAYPASVPHIHMGLYTSTTACGQLAGRTPVPFAGPYQIDGQGYEVGDAHADTEVTSTNVPADIDGDGELTILDYNWLLSCTPPTDNCSEDEAAGTDLNRDGRLDEIDYEMMEQAFDAWGAR